VRFIAPGHRIRERKDAISGEFLHHLQAAGIDASTAIRAVDTAVATSHTTARRQNHIVRAP